MNGRVYSLLVVLWAGLSVAAHADEAQLVPVARFADKAISESSGIVKSRQFEGVYWTHNDSGDAARIFAITEDGAGIQTPWAIENKRPNEGIEIGEATHIDWEDITTDDQGNLIIAACGNNDNARKDLAIYILREPDPRFAFKARATKRIDFHYPDQTAFPDPKRKNFDCEAIFFADGKVYFVSKNRSTGPAKLYRLDHYESGKSHPLTLIGTHELKGQVTGADATPDNAKVAILTYNGVWVFERPTAGDNFFDGKAYYKPIRAKQCEAICWKDDETLLITNEQGELFELSLADIPSVHTASQ